MLLLEKIRRKNQNLTISRRDPPTEFSEAITNDLLIEIFSRLPAKSIARCRCVSKLWRSTLLLKEFTDSHLARSSSHPQLLLSCIKDGNIHFFSTSHKVHNSDYYGAEIVVPNYHMKLNFVTHSSKLNFDTHSSKYCGSVNGLVCLTNVRICEGVREIVPVICNISTGQSLLTLPAVTTKEDMEMFEVHSFFGYDPVEKQFKILSMTLPRSRIGMRRRRISGEHQVLTLGVENPSWRMVSSGRFHTPCSSRVCINGVLYYTALVRSHFAIVCFDFRSEKFKVIEKGNGMKFLIGSTLVNYNGKLGVFFVDGYNRYPYPKGLTGKNKSFELRVLEDPENVVWSKHVYELPSMWATNDTLRFVGVTGTNEIVLAPFHLSDLFYVFYYNTERKTVRRVEIGGMASFKDCEIRACADHVENVKLMEMFKTYDLN